MGIAENKRVVQAFFESGNRGEGEAALDLLADDVTWTNIGSTKFSGAYAGKQTVINELVGPLFGELEAGIHGTIDNLVAEGDYVVAQVRGQARKKDGTPYNNTYCHVFRLRDGKIVAVNEYMDTELITAVFGSRR